MTVKDTDMDTAASPTPAPAAATVGVVGANCKQKDNDNEVNPAINCQLMSDTKPTQSIAPSPLDNRSPSQIPSEACGGQELVVLPPPTIHSPTVLRACVHNIHISQG